MGQGGMRTVPLSILRESAFQKRTAVQGLQETSRRGIGRRDLKRPGMEGCGAFIRMGGRALMKRISCGWAYSLALNRAQSTDEDIFNESKHGAFLKGFDTCLVKSCTNGFPS